MSRNASTDELYFATLTVVDWIDVFTRRVQRFYY
jgi:putative transposase